MNPGRSHRANHRHRFGMLGRQIQFHIRIDIESLEFTNQNFLGLGQCHPRELYPADERKIDSTLLIEANRLVCQLLHLQTVNYELVRGLKDVRSCFLRLRDLRWCSPLTATKRHSGKQREHNGNVIEADVSCHVMKLFWQMLFWQKDDSQERARR